MAIGGRALLDAATGKVLASQLPAAGATQTVEQYYTNQGYGLLGLTAPASVFFDDFIMPSLTGGVLPRGTIVTSGAGSSLVIKSGGQHVALATKGAASGYSYLYTSLASNKNSISGGWNTQKCYAAAKIAFTSAINNVVQGGIGCVDGGSTDAIFFGVNGPISTTHFVLHAGTNNLTTTVAIDTNPHVFEVYSDGAGNIYGRIDGVAVGSAAFGGAWGTAGGTFWPIFLYSSDANARTLEEQWYLFMVENT
jgi:hypothetical protein